MKKIVLFLSMCLLFAGSALGETIKYRGLTLEVPEGYSYENEFGTLYISNPEKTSFIGFSIEDSQGDSAEVIALSLSAGMDGTAPARLDNGFFASSFKLENGAPGELMVDVNGHDALVIILGGSDPLLKNMFANIK